MTTNEQETRVHRCDLSAAAQEAAGALEAQRVLDCLARGTMAREHAWLAFVELSARHGRNSVAARAFLLEAFKRADA